MRRTLNFLINLGTESVVPPLSVGFVLDLSGSMAGEPRQALKRALIQAVADLSVRVGSSPDDEATVVVFDTDIRDLCPWIPREEFDFLTDCLAALPDACLGGGGTTRLYDAVWHAADRFLRTSKTRNERILVLCSDGGEYGSTERKRKDVSLKLLECNNGSISRAMASDLAASNARRAILDSLFKESDESFIAIRPIDSSDLADTDADLRGRVLAELAESRRPLRVFALHFGSEDNGLMRGLAEETGGVYLRGADEDAIAGLLEGAVRALAARTGDGVRGRLSRRLAAARVISGDFARLISVNTKPGTAAAISETEVESGPTYDFVYPVEGDRGSERDDILLAFRAAGGLADRVGSVLVGQSRLASYRNAGVRSEPLIVVAVRGGDTAGLALAEECVRAVEEANRNGALFPSGEGAGAEVVFTVLLDGWEDYDRSQWHRLYAFLLELSNTTLASSIMGVSLLGTQNESEQNNQGRGFTQLGQDEFEWLVVEVLTSLNRWQSASAMLSDLANRQGACSRFVSVGALSLFLQEREATRLVAGRQLAAVLTEIFEAAPPWVNPASAREAAEAFDADVAEGRLWDRLVASGKPGVTLLDVIAGPGVIAFATFEAAKTLVLPDHTSSDQATRQVTYRYEDFEDYAAKTPLDVEEYVSVSHSLDFFRARLEANAEAVSDEIRQNLETRTDAHLCRMVDSASPAQARLFLENLAVRIRDRIARAGEGFANVLTERTAQVAPDVITVRLHSDAAIQKRASDWERFRAEAIHLLRTRPHPHAVRAKYVEMAAVLGTAAIAALLAGTWLWAPLALAGGVMPLGATWKLSRRARQIAELLELYEAAHRAVARQEAIQLVRETIGRIWQQLLTNIGEADEPPEGQEVDPYSVEQVSERSLLEMFRRDVSQGLAEWLRLQPEDPEESAFRLNLARTRLRLPRSIEGPLSGVGADLGFHASTSWKRSLIEAEAAVHPAQFPSTIARFVPPNLGSLPAATAAKLLVREILRETRYQLVALAALGHSDTQALKGLYENAEWARTVDRLAVASQTPVETRTGPVFLLWRAIAQYRLWLLRLARLVAAQDDREHELDVYSVWRRLARSRREFRAALQANAEQTIGPEIANALLLFRLLGEDSYEPGPQLFDYVDGFSEAPVRLQRLGASYPDSCRWYFASGSSLSIQEATRPFGTLPNARWQAMVPRGLRRSAPAGVPEELIGDHEVAFIQAVAVPSTHVETLSAAAKSFLDLQTEKQRGYLLGAYHKLIDGELRSHTANVCWPFLNPDAGPRPRGGPPRRAEDR